MIVATFMVKEFRKNRGKTIANTSGLFPRQSGSRSVKHLSPDACHSHMPVKLGFLSEKLGEGDSVITLGRSRLFSAALLGEVDREGLA